MSDAISDPSVPKAVRSTGGTWRQLSAVTSGVADARALVAEAKALREVGGRTILFIDELHRFNKAQQDALLPHVEDGTITLIGATTENPYYELNSPLLSRLRVYRLDPLDTEDLSTIVDRALTDPDGLAGRVSLTDDGLATLLDLSGGDARQALNVLERRKITSIVVIDDQHRVEGVVHLHDLWKTGLV